MRHSARVVHLGLVQCNERGEATRPAGRPAKPGNVKSLGALHVTSSRGTCPSSVPRCDLAGTVYEAVDSGRRKVLLSLVLHRCNGVAVPMHPLASRCVWLSEDARTRAVTERGS